MTTNTYRVSEAEFCDSCTFPALRELLPDYLADQLGDAAAERIEDHLLTCRPCREQYLELLKLLGSAFVAFTELTMPNNDGNRTTHDERAAGGAKVLKLDDFRKRQS